MNTADDARRIAAELGLDEDSQLTTAQVIELSGLSDRQVRRLYKKALPSSEIPGRKGPERRVRLADLLTWIETRPAATTAQKSPRTIDTSATADQVQKLLELLEDQDAKIDALTMMSEALNAKVHHQRESHAKELEASRAEVHDLRGQLEQRDTAMTRMIEALVVELHDTRGQLHQLKTDILKALPARIEDAEIEPAKPRSKFLQWWRKH
jgi:DNA-binding transcriptional MerR regulator